MILKMRAHSSNFFPSLQMVSSLSTALACELEPHSPSSESGFLDISLTPSHVLNSLDFRVGLMFLWFVPMFRQLTTLANYTLSGFALCTPGRLFTTLMP